MPNRQAEAAPPPGEAIPGICGKLFAKGYEVKSIVADETTDRFTVTYFPASAIRGRAIIADLPWRAMVERVEDLPPAPDLDPWTRLSLDLGRQGGAYIDEANWEREHIGGPCMDCEVLTATATRGEGKERVALCAACAASFDRSPDRAAADIAILQAEREHDWGDDADAPY